MGHHRDGAPIQGKEPPLDTAGLAEVQYHERIRDRNILTWFRNGESIADIADYFFVSEAWVRKLTGTERTENPEHVIVQHLTEDT